MAIPTYQAQGAVAESASANVSPAWPAHLTGDVALLFVESEATGIHLSVPAGFREVFRSPAMPRSVGGSSDALTVFWCRATSAAMSAPTVAFQGMVANARLRALIMTFRGCGATGQPWNIAAARSSWGVANSSPTIPGGPTTHDDCLLVLAVAHARNFTGESVSGWSNGSLTNLTERYDNASTIGGGGALAIATGEKALAGTVSFTQATLTGSFFWTSIMIALTPVEQTEDSTPYIFGAGPVEESSSGAITPDWPSGHQADDIGLLIINSGGYPFVGPSGWTEADSSPQSSTTSGNAALASLHVFWKRATGGAEASPSVPFVADHVQGFILVIRGVGAGLNPAYDASSGRITNPASSNATFPGLTTTRGNSLVIQLLAHGINSVNDPVNPDTIPGSNAAFGRDYVSWGFVNSTIGAGSGINVVRGKKVTPGVISDTVVAMAIGSTQQQAAISLAFGTPVKTFTLSKGTFTLTGHDLAFRRLREFLLEKGTFALTGQDLTFTGSNFVTFPLGKGSFQVTGRDLTFTKTFGRWTTGTPKTAVWTKKPQEF